MTTRATVGLTPQKLQKMLADAYRAGFNAGRVLVKEAAPATADAIFKSGLKATVSRLMDDAKPARRAW